MSGKMGSCFVAVISNDIGPRIAAVIITHVSTRTLFCLELGVCQYLFSAYFSAMVHLFLSQTKITFYYRVVCVGLYDIFYLHDIFLSFIIAPGLSECSGFTRGLITTS